MGDPKFPRRKFATPFHPWKADRIAEENALQKKYGLKNKKEVWRSKSHLRTFRGQARELLAKSRTGDVQAQKETNQLLAKLGRMGVLSETATLDDVLALNVEQVLGRRLQTLVYLRGYTASTTQARQFISHGHILVGGTRVNVPGYYVKRGEEEAITLNPNRAVADDAHPARPKRVEGQGPPRLMDIPTAPPERRGGGRGPPRGGGFPPRRAPPPPAAPAATDVAPPAPHGGITTKEDREKKPAPRKSKKTEGGGAF